MNRLNPLHLVVVLLTITIISYVIMIQQKNRFLTQHHEYHQFVLLAQEFGSLKKNSLNKNRVIRTVNTITAQRELKNATMSVQNSKRGIRISLQSDKPDVIHRFVNRILNEKLPIIKFELKSDKIDLEIGI